MKRTPLLVLVCTLCVWIATLFAVGSYAETSYEALGGTASTGSKCVSEPALPGYKWYGKAPLCNGKKAKKDCKDADGDVMKTNACGDGSKCSSGYKVLCRMPNASQYQQAPDTTTSTGGTWSTVTVQGEDSGTDKESTSTKYENTDTTINATTKSIRYLGNPPFCNADNKVRQCKDMKGEEVGRSKCNAPGKYQKCCKSGKWLQCLAPDITGG